MISVNTLIITALFTVSLVLFLQHPALFIIEVSLGVTALCIYLSVREVKLAKKK